MPAPLTMPRFHVGCRLGLLDKSNFVCAQASNASESDCILISNPRGFLNHTKFILLSNQIYFLFLFFWSQTILAKHDWKISTYKVKSKSSKWLFPGSPRLPEIDPRFPQNFHAVSLRLPLVAQWLPCCCPEVALRLPWGYPEVALKLLDVASILPRGCLVVASWWLSHSCFLVFWGWLARLPYFMAETNPGFEQKYPSTLSYKGAECKKLWTWTSALILLAWP